MEKVIQASNYQAKPMAMFPIETSNIDDWK